MWIILHIIITLHLNFYFALLWLYMYLLQVLIPIMNNNHNQSGWPSVVTQDIGRHVGALKGDVLTLSGQVKGRTLLPLPPQTDLLIEAAELEAM